MIPRKWKIHKAKIPKTYWERPDGSLYVEYRLIWRGTNGELICESPFDFESLCKGIRKLIKERPELA